MIKLFAPQDIAAFCDSIGDTNKLHSPGEMERAGYFAVSPGMFTMACALANASESLAKMSTARVYFGSSVFEGDRVEFGKFTANGLEHRVLALKGGTDVLTYHAADGTEAHSVLYNGPGIYTAEQPSIQQPMELQRYGVFKRLIRPCEDSTARFLYAVSIASSAFFAMLKNPSTEDQRQFSARFTDAEGKGQPILPVFGSVELFRQPRYSPDAAMPGSLDFSLSVAPNGKREYALTVGCTQNGESLYAARFNVLLLEERVVFRRIMKPRGHA